MSERLLIQSTRIGMYILIVSLTLMNHLIQDNFFNWQLMLQFYGWSAVGLFIHGLALLNLDGFFRQKPLVFFSFIVDLGLITTLLVTSGLNQSLFLFLYLVTIILAGLVFHLRGALIMAVLSSICYTLGSWFGPEIKAMAFLFMLVLNNIAFFGIAFLAGYLSDQLNLFAEKIEAQNLSLRIVRRLNEMIVETIPAGLLSMNSSGEILQSNPAADRLFSRTSLEGISLFELIPSLKDRALLGAGKPQSSDRVEISFRHDGDEKLFGIQILPQLSDFDQPTYLVIIEDLTDVRKLELAVRQSEKMVAIGQLAAGIAHEIRNPLAGISGSVELLSQHFSSEDDRKLGKIILKEIDRLNRLISEFLDYAKPEKPPVDFVDLNSLLKESVGNAQTSSKNFESIQIDWQMASESKVLGYADKLKQVFLNLILNAFQAMTDSAQKTLSIQTELQGDLLVVKIRDTGSGMKPETLKRIFEPFHTTKPKGTGLGLAISHKILQAHSAQIFVESQSGLGSEFQIKFQRKSFENSQVASENKV